MKVARQFTAWNRFGKERRPARDGLNKAGRTSFLVPFENKARYRDQTVPTGRVAYVDISQAIKCLATFISSLRDKHPTSAEFRRFHLHCTNQSTRVAA